MRGRIKTGTLAPRALFSACGLVCGWLCGCKALAGSLNEPVREYFEYHTESAAITRYEIAGGNWRTDSLGVVNVGSEEELRVAFYLRNPQRFSFSAGGDGTSGSLLLDFPAAPASALSSAVSIAQDSRDAAVITLVYSKEFLRAAECGGDISPEIRLLHPVSRADFGTYSAARFLSNSPPPPVRDAAVYLDAAQNVYVICFNMPSEQLLTDGTGLHRDIRRFAANGRQFDVSVSDGRLCFSDGRFSVPGDGAVPAHLRKSADSAAEFVPDADRAVYFTTGDAVSDENASYELSYSDARGLSNSSAVAARSLRLADVSIFDADGFPIEDGAVLSQDDGSAFAAVTLVPPERSPDGLASTADSFIIYEVYQGADASGMLVDSGCSKGRTAVQIPGGRFFIRAAAHKDLYVDSFPLERRVIVCAERVCVSASGDDGNTGSEMSPFKTVARAVDMLAAQGTVVLLSDISEPGPLAVGGAGSADIVFDGGGHRLRFASDDSAPSIVVREGSSLRVKSCRIEDGAGIRNAGRLVLEDAVLSGGGDVILEPASASISVSGCTKIDGAIDFSAYAEPLPAVFVAGPLSESRVAALRLGSAYDEGDAVLSGADGYRLSGGDCAKFTVSGDFLIKLDQERNLGVIVSARGGRIEANLSDGVSVSAPKSAVYGGTIELRAERDGGVIDVSGLRIVVMNRGAEIPCAIDGNRVSFPSSGPDGEWFQIIVAFECGGVFYGGTLDIQLSY